MDHSCFLIFCFLIFCFLIFHFPHFPLHVSSTARAGGVYNRPDLPVRLNSTKSVIRLRRRGPICVRKTLAISVMVLTWRGYVSAPLNIVPPGVHKPNCYPSKPAPRQHDRALVQCQ